MFLESEELVIGSMEIDREESPDVDFNLVLQEFLHKHQLKVSLYNLDSIFSQLILAKNIKGDFIIQHIDLKNDSIIETTNKIGGYPSGIIKSEIIPTRMDKSEGVQVLLVSPYRSIFLQMLAILFLSVVLILFVFYALFYQMTSLIKEKHLRQLHRDFTHALTHDMATPLQTIAQVNKLLANEKLYDNSEKRRKYIDIAEQQILNLQALTDRILSVARAEKSALETNLSEVNPKKIIMPLVDKFKIQAKKPLSFNLSFSPDEIKLHVDALLFSNAVSNLIDNSLKYSGEAVKIDIRSEERNGDVFIYIKDNGYGISEKDQSKIFLSFERGKAVSRNEAKGFGIGLNYVKAVMDAHGGRVSLFSEEGKGSEFVLFFPAKKEI